MSTTLVFDIFGPTRTDVCVTWLPAKSLSLQLYEYVQTVSSLKTPKSEPNRQQHCKKA